MNKQKEEFNEDYQNIEHPKAQTQFSLSIPLKKTTLQPIISHTKVLNQTADQIEAFHRREQGKKQNKRFQMRKSSISI